MSVKALDAVWENSRATGTARLLLLAIADEANSHGECSAYKRSQASLARKVGVRNADTIRKATRDLEKLGELTVTAGQGAQQTNYQIRLPGLTPISTEGTAPVAPDGTPTEPDPATQMGHPLHPEGANADHTSYTKPVLPVTPRSAPSADVERLCTLLADLIEGNGSKRPTITKRWHDECDRMLRLDGRTPEKIEACVRWSQSDPFWRANILSMPTLREKYDQLRLAAQRGRPADNTVAQLHALEFDGGGNLITQEGCA